MKILSKTNINIPTGKLAKMLAKQMYKKLGGSYKIEYGSNEFDVYFLLYYQLPAYNRNSDLDNDINEMKIDLNIATYQNKIRINLIEITPEERTIGHDVYEPEFIQNDINYSIDKIWDKVKNRLNKAYEEYDFVF